MKGIILLFLFVFASLGAGVYFYETQIASPRAADSLVKVNKKESKPKVVIVKAAGIPVLTPVEESRIIERSYVKQSDGRSNKQRLIKNRAIDASISSTINKSIRLEIQKAVVSEMERQR